MNRSVGVITECTQAILAISFMIFMFWIVTDFLQFREERHNAEKVQVVSVTDKNDNDITDNTALLDLKEETNSLKERLDTLIELASLEAYEKNKAEEAVPMKINRKAFKKCKKLAKLVKKHQKIENKLIKDLAKLNSTTEENVSNSLYKYNFIVDYSQQKAKAGEPVTLKMNDKQKVKLMKINSKINL